MKKLEDREWWPELVALKDVFSLRELAARYGAAPAAIANALRRNKLDRAPAPSGPRVHRSQDWRQAASETLTQVTGVEPPPAELAAVVTANDEAAFDGAEGRDVRGYRVMINEHPYIVVARDVAEAARIATTAARGEVAAIELLGKAISA